NREFDVRREAHVAGAVVGKLIQHVGVARAWFGVLVLLATSERNESGQADPAGRDGVHGYFFFSQSEFFFTSASVTGTMAIVSSSVPLAWSTSRSRHSGLPSRHGTHEAPYPATSVQMKSSG